VFIEAKDDGGGGDNWTTGAISHAKLQSNHHHQQTNIQFFYSRMPFQSPNQQCQSTEWNGLNWNDLWKIGRLNRSRKWYFDWRL